MVNRMDEPTLLAALQAQAEGYRSLAEMADAQRRHVRENQNDALLDVLHQRQAVLDRILAAEQTVGPARRDWAATAAVLSVDGRAAAERLLADTRSLLERITAADRDDVVVLQQRKINLGRQIDRTAAAKAVNRTYAAAAYGAAKPSVDVSR